MKDRELLELAAKAAGLFEYTEWSDQITDYDSPHYMSWALHKPGAGGECSSWNPLTDDGDALRLATALELNVFHAGGNAYAMQSEDDGRYERRVSYRDAVDKYAAARQAIVQAAAEIGKAG